MLFILIGPSCSGKSSVAREINTIAPCETWFGKDYIRLSTQESDAWNLFKRKMIESGKTRNSQMPALVFVVTDSLSLSAEILNLPFCLSIKMTAPIEILTERFAQRLSADPPVPIIEMLKRQIISLTSFKADLEFDSSRDALDRIREEIKTRIPAGAA